MSYTETISDESGNFTETIKDEKLADLRSRGANCTFRVLEDEWSEDLTTRIIRNVEILSVSFDSAGA